MVEWRLSQIKADEAKGRMEQDQWCELILEHLVDMKEASNSEAFEKCYDNKNGYRKRSNIENRMVGTALTLFGWERVGKFTSGNK